LVPPLLWSYIQSNLVGDIALGELGTEETFTDLGPWYEHLPGLQPADLHAAQLAFRLGELEPPEVVCPDTGVVQDTSEPGDVSPSSDVTSEGDIGPSLDASPQGWEDAPVSPEDVEESTPEDVEESTPEDVAERSPEDAGDRAATPEEITPSTSEDVAGSADTSQSTVPEASAPGVEANEPAEAASGCGGSPDGTPGLVVLLALLGCVVLRRRLPA